MEGLKSSETGQGRVRFSDFSGLEKSGAAGGRGWEWWSLPFEHFFVARLGVGFEDGGEVRFGF